MSSILLTDDSWCELSSEAEGRDLTPVSFGQIPADMPMDVSAFLLREGLDEASSGQWLWWDEKARIWGRMGKMKALMGWCSLIAWTCSSMQLCTGPVSDLSFALRLCCHQLWREPWVCQMLSNLSEIRVQDLPHGARRRTLQMPNCKRISLQLVASLFSAACVLTLTATLPLYLCAAAALSALISVASSRCSSNSSDK